MTGFSFTFSYDRNGNVAWLALEGDLDGPAARRLRRVLRATVDGLAPRRLLVDARDLTDHEGVSLHRLIRGGVDAERAECDVVLVTRGPARVAPSTAEQAVA
ncbi:hypothetical protein [Phytohabitans flavus]|uniref:STAS domain-containing protein n=1 Tax=Phytohabitans flavus TaxID=1076124 RepID=A0A6F8XPK5_9ACTN|nr:hypothetical protein [Phytohabitans flavus]BCB75756.1 hypothetical protein Pflav_021660 [Phytohabitans flavus]